MSCAISSVLATTASNERCRTSARCRAGVAAQPAPAAAAASSARTASTSVASATAHSTWPVAGFVTLNVAPSAACSDRPAIQTPLANVSSTGWVVVTGFSSEVGSWS